MTDVMEYEKELIRRAVGRFTLRRQIIQAIEELSELTAELTRWLEDEGRTDEEKIAEETADVQIVCRYAEMLAGPERVAKWRKFKLKRLEKKLNGYENRNQMP